MSVMDNKGKEDLIAGIENDARAEAEAILRKADEYVADRINSCKRQVTQIKEEAEKRLALQKEEIQKTYNSSISVEKRRTALKVRDQIINQVITRVRRKLEEMIQEPGYGDILKDWIVEGVIGLNVNEAAVNASKEETRFLDQSLLKKAAAKVKELSGLEVKLTKAGGDPVIGQGVVITASNGRTAFNNQVKTRLLRYQTELRKVIYDSLFRDMV